MPDSTKERKHIKNPQALMENWTEASVEVREIRVCSCPFGTTEKVGVVKEPTATV